MENMDFSLEIKDGIIVRNIDDNSLIGYFDNSKDACEAAENKHIISNVKLLYVLDDIYHLATPNKVEINVDLVKKLEFNKEKALSKLTDYEKEILGLNRNCPN